MGIIEQIENEQLKSSIDKFNVGDTVKVHFNIVEGTRERIQIYEGLVIAFKNSGPRKTFCVRKISSGVGVERIFPIHSSRIKKVEVTRYGRVRRAKLYYIRDRVGKASKVPELIRRKSVKTAAAKKDE